MSCEITITSTLNLTANPLKDLSHGPISVGLTLTMSHGPISVGLTLTMARAVALYSCIVTHCHITLCVIRYMVCMSCDTTLTLPGERGGAIWLRLCAGSQGSACWVLPDLLGLLLFKVRVRVRVRDRS